MKQKVLAAALALALLLGLLPAAAQARGDAAAQDVTTEGYPTYDAIMRRGGGSVL